MKVRLSATTVENVNERIPVERFLERHSRWLKMRAVIHLGGFLGDLGANPVALGAFAMIASGFDPRFVAAFAGLATLKATADATVIRMLRPEPMRVRHLVLAPFKDLLMGSVWFYSMFSRSVDWRGKKLRFGKDSRLRPDDGALPVRVVRSLLSPFRA
jgi:ceramide glucosyltransferase